jgi:hypothetical protein
MLFSAVRRLVLRAGTKYADAHKIFSVAGLLLDNVELTKPNRSALETWFSQPGVLFGGWRQYPTNLDLPLMSLTKTYLLVRDPRDIATSKYFSIRYSHTTSGAGGAAMMAKRRAIQEIDIDGYALEHAEVLRHRFAAYMPLKETQLMVRRYEDIIFNKRTFLRDICSHFGFEVRPAALERIADSIDSRPENEDIHAHVRQVNPGDHRRKLKPETIERMNEILADVLVAYDYPPNVETANV